MTRGHAHIAALLANVAGRRGDAVAIRDESGPTISYARLHSLAADIAASLDAGGFGKSGRRPRFGIVMPNGAGIAVALLGATLAGEAAPFNSVSTASEFSNYFSATGIDALIVRASEDGPAATVAGTMGIPLLRLTADYRIAGLEPGPRAAVAPQGGDVALVLMTSGSTGRPKIVPLTHRNVCCSAEEVSRSIALAPEDRCLVMWEQFHIGGLVDLLLAPLASGGTIIATGGFDAAKFFRLLEQERPTWYQAVPTMLNELVFHAERNRIATRPNSLRLIRSVAAALSPALMARVVDAFGVPVVRTLGMTEASPLITSTPLPPLPQKPGSVGKSCGTEIRIFGADGKALGPGLPGEVAIRGENVFSGYEGDDEANRASFRDGWFLTGDVGYIDDDGDLFLTGRIKQMINRGGEKISPQEVDDVLSSHPAVVEAATFAVGHRTLGEDVAAAVVVREPVDLPALRSFVGERLAPFKVPQRIVVVESLPRNPVGKIDRLALAKRLDGVSAEAGAGAHSAPRNPMEEMLARLWARELSLPEVGVNQDFAELGGDSLSSIRILLATEAALGSKVPGHVFARYGTIAEIAARLIELGLSPRGDGEASIDARAAKSLDAVTVGMTGFEDALPELIGALETCEDEERFRVIADGMTVYATPAEIRALLDATEGVRLASRAAAGAGLLSRLALRRTYRGWRRALLREVGLKPRDAAWRRKTILPDALLYHDPAVPAAGKRLVIGFTGNLARLMQPTYRILTNLDPDRFDLLLLRDPAKALFRLGLPGVGPDLGSVAEFTRRVAAEGGHASVATLGTSGGGPAALCSGLVNGWPKAVAVCSPGPSRNPELVAMLSEAKAAAGGEDSRLVLAFGSNQRDIDAARQLKELLPAAEMDQRPAYRTHNILNEAYGTGQLRGLLEDWFG